jgi:hypothetical protein
MLTIPVHEVNANQNHTKIPPHSFRILPRPPPASVGKAEGKKEPSYTTGGNVS